MPLQTLQLDTLNWQQMVTAIRGRIIPNSNAKWTLQAPVDPGVTLLELYAWLLDQRIYWINQIPDALVQAILALLGEAPNPAQAAVTVLQLSDAARPQRSFPVAKAATLMELGDLNPPILFTLDQDLALLPVQGIGVTVNGTDRTNDLLQKRPVALLAPGQKSSAVQFLFQLNTQLTPAVAGQFFSLMLRLYTPEDVYEQWSPRAVAGIGTRSTLNWLYTSSNSNSAVPFAANQVDDGTEGLRRSGIVRFAVPSDWQAEAANGAPGITTYGITLNITNADFTYTPQLTQAVSNVVMAHHRWQRKAAYKPANWPPLPGNVINLPVPSAAASPWKEFPPIEDTVQLTLTGPDGKATQWRQVPDLNSYGPTDNVFVMDRARAQIRFGDGLAGRLPRLSLTSNSPITVSYMAGGGLTGNVGESTLWNAVQEDPAAPNLYISGASLASAAGGADTETLQEAIQRSQASLNDRSRAVTKPDFENLAITTKGVAIRRAYAAVGHDPQFPCSKVAGAVTVFVVPYAPRIETEGSIPNGAFVAAPKPDAGALQAVYAQISAGKLLGGQFFVSPPVYRKVWLSLQIAVDFPLSRLTRESVLESLQAYLDPLVGGDEGNGWPFGDPLRPSGLLKVAQQALGEAGDVLSVGVSVTGTGNFQSCLDTPILPHELVYLVHAVLATQRRTPQGGGLR